MLLIVLLFAVAMFVVLWADRRSRNDKNCADGDVRSKPHTATVGIECAMNDPRIEATHSGHAFVSWQNIGAIGQLERFDRAIAYIPEIIRCEFKSPCLGITAIEIGKQSANVNRIIVNGPNDRRDANQGVAGGKKFQRIVQDLDRLEGMF